MKWCRDELRIAKPNTLRRRAVGGMLVAVIAMWGALLLGTLPVSASTPATGTLSGAALAAAKQAAFPNQPALQVSNLSEWTESRLAIEAPLRESVGPDVLCCGGGTPSSATVGADQQTQLNNYYCGPATASETLGDLGRSVSQTTAASLLATTTNGTNWAGGDNVPHTAPGYGYSNSPMTHLLNYKLGEWWYGPVPLPWTPTAAQTTTYEGDLEGDILDGYPVVSADLEVAGGPHLNGQPIDESINHWVMIRGYSSYGATTAYEDSATYFDQSPWYWMVPAYSNISSATLVVIMGGFGYIW